MVQQTLRWAQEHQLACLSSARVRLVEIVLEATVGCLNSLAQERPEEQVEGSLHTCMLWGSTQCLRLSKQVTACTAF